MKVKTITAIAIAMSASSAHALVGPVPNPPKERTVCLGVAGTDDYGTTYASDCDESERNVMYQRTLTPSGCAEGQIAIKTTRLVVRSCPTYVQL